MGISFRIHGEHGFFISEWVGPISDSDLVPAYMELLGNEAYRPGFHELTDLRRAQMGGVTSTGLRSLALVVERHLAGKCDSFRTAVVAPEDLEFGLSRVYEAMSRESPEHVMVFRSETSPAGS